jgi:hypothetical protein
MRNLLFVLAVTALLSFTAVAQEQEKPAKWQIHGFVEQQYRPGQDFGSTAAWVTVKKEGSTVGLFNFLQVVTPVNSSHVDWGQNYSGLFAGKATKFGYFEGGAAAGLKTGGKLQTAVYGVAAPKKAFGVSAFVIHEQGPDKGSSWTRVHVMRPVPGTPCKVGYHHQTGLGNGVNADCKIGKTGLSFFGALTRDNGTTKAMTALRYNF